MLLYIALFYLLSSRKAAKSKDCGQINVYRPLLGACDRTDVIHFTGIPPTQIY